MPGWHGGDEDDDAAGGLREWYEARLANVEAELAQALTELAKAREHIRAQDEVDRILARGLPPAADGSTGPIARVQGPRATGHRKDRGYLRLVRLLIPAAFLARLAVRGSAARRVTGVALAAMVGVPATIGVARMQNTPDYSSAAPAPVAVTVPVAPAAAHAHTAVSHPHRHHHHTDVPVHVPRVPVVASRPSPHPSPSQPPSAPAPPLLLVPAGPVDLGVYMSTAIQISNPQNQSVAWSVTCGPDVTVSPAMGFLEPGEQNVELQVSISPSDGASGAMCVFSPGSERMAVVWAGAGAPSAGTG